MRERRSGATISVPPGVEIVEATGPFFFGVAEKIQEVLSDIEGAPRVFILRMRHVPTLEALGRRCSAQGTTFILCEVRRGLIRKLIRARELLDERT